MALTKAHNRMIANAAVNVKDYGATGDGTTNDTTAIQAAIDAVTSGGVVYFPAGTYRIARTAGTDDRWGVKITNSNVTLRGDHAVLRRFDTDISTYANSYPLIFVGTPDNDSASATENITIEGLEFVGEDTRHAISGSAPMDYRCAIMFKNTKKTKVQNCEFNTIDSSAIYYQSPVSYNYVNSRYINTTKNYQSHITNCFFYANSHTTAGRALLHAINSSGLDYFVVDQCYAEWCDNFIAGSGTYDDIDDVETDTYTPTVAGWTFGAVKRCGRGWVVSNNTIINSSEHAVYLEGMDASVTGNNLRAENTTYCLGDIKIRSRNVAITGNTVHAGGTCISINELSYQVTVANNTCYMQNTTTSGGAIDVNSDGIKAYIDARSDFHTTYEPMDNIAVTGNSIYFPETATTGVSHVGIRLYSDNVDASFPEGNLRNITVSGNSINNHRIGIYTIGTGLKNVLVEGNSFNAKTFTSSGFSGGTTLNTYATLMTNRSSSDVNIQVRFTNNTVYGSEHLFATDNGAGTSVHIPWQLNANSLNYIKNFKTSDMRTPEQFNQFQNNIGTQFLDRTGWVGAHSLNNSLGSGTTNSEKKYNLAYNGTNVIFYTDDSGTTLTL